MDTVAPFSYEFWVAMAPETVLLIGLVAISVSYTHLTLPTKRIV